MRHPFDRTNHFCIRRIALFGRSLAMVSCVLLLLCQCKKEELSKAAPTILFKTSQGFTSSDKTIRLGETVRIGIVADANGGENITMFEYKINGGNYQATVDSGLNKPSIDYERLIAKGIHPEENWTFTVKNKAGIKNSVSVKLTLDTSSKYNPIEHISSLKLGAQNNQTIGCAYSFANKSIYTIKQAAQNQTMIDFLCYYDFLVGENNCVSSPGGNIDASVYGGEYSPVTWTIRNTSRFELTTTAVQDFNRSANDSLIYAKTFEYGSGKRKCKNLAADDIYSFILNNGKKGLFKVLSVTGTDAGTVELEIKMQK